MVILRNEKEVEGKFVIHTLLPLLGVTPERWFQEVNFGSIRLDFLVMPLGGRSPACLPNSLIIEAKHPRQVLDRHTRRLWRYMTQLGIDYAILTNGREFCFYRQSQLVFRCANGNLRDEKIQQIRQVLEPPIRKTFAPPPCPPPLPKERTMNVITVYHNKGGVGKTTTVINLAATLSRKGYQILIIDLDSQANTTFAAGLMKFLTEEEDDLQEKNVYHVIESANTAIADVVRLGTFSNPPVQVLPSHISLVEYEYKLVNAPAAKNRLSRKLSKVASDYDFVIIDTPPSLNIFASIAMLTTDYLIIPSDLKPFSNEGLRNVRKFLAEIDEERETQQRPPVHVLGLLPSKISTNPRFREYSLPRRLEAAKKYGFQVFESVIFERDDLAKSLEQVTIEGNYDVPNPQSVLDFKPDSESAGEFEALTQEVLQKISTHQKKGM
ncbi:MAG: AAA family ATPase [Oscillatoriales cyanobacterium SM2_2_1]|nr:AAA family ATPase [Oscillatoriales cyanobacterium SM2_2_1]